MFCDDTVDIVDRAITYARVHGDADKTRYGMLAQPDGATPFRMRPNPDNFSPSQAFSKSVPPGISQSQADAPAPASKRMRLDPENSTAEQPCRGSPEQPADGVPPLPPPGSNPISMVPPTPAPVPCGTAGCTRCEQGGLEPDLWGYEKAQELVRKRMPRKVKDFAKVMDETTLDGFNHLFCQPKSLSVWELKSVWIDIWGSWQTSSTWDREKTMGASCSVAISLDVVDIPNADHEIKIKVGRPYGMRLVATYSELPYSCPNGVRPMGRAAN